MRNGLPCPKCHGHDIIRIPDDVFSGIGLGNRIPTRWRAVRVTRFMCGACGYLEEYVEAPKDIERIRSRWGSSS
jgi:Zn ribbon nucleic-acid-binding protein